MARGLFAIEDGKKKNGIIVYYSWTGNTQKIAEALSRRLGLELFKIEDKRPRSFVGSVCAALVGHRARIKDMPDITGAQYVFIGTPIWANSMSSPINTFLSHADFALKKVYGFCTMASANDVTRVQSKLERVVGEKGGRFQTLFEYVSFSKKISEQDAEQAVGEWLSGIKMESTD